jgi:predicted transcriptional regulator
MDDDHLALIVTGVFLVAVMICSPWSGLVPNGYVVTPATDADLKDATPVETVQVSFWELPPRVMLLSVILSISPLLVFPVELFFFLKMFSYLGYRKIAAASVLDSPARTVLYDAIVKNPGIFFNELVRITGMKQGTLRYHIAILKLTGKITDLDARGDTRYFENSGRFTVTEQKVLKYLRNSRERSIFEYLMENPAMTRKDLVERLGVSGATVSWYTGRLSDDGLLVVAKVGKNVRYEINSEVRHFLEKYLKPLSGDQPSQTTDSG